MSGIDIEPVLSFLLPTIGSSRVAVFFLVIGLGILTISARVPGRTTVAAV
jgi:hypothetical protein